MKTLRLLHLYLGCAFAPLLIFFAVSGIFQRINVEWYKLLPRVVREPMMWFLTLHSGRSLKLGETLSSSAMTVLVLLMSASLILTIVLGIIMAFRFGHRKAALLCLGAGLLIPVAVCVMTMSVE